MCGRLTVTSKERLIKRFNPDKVRAMLKGGRFNVCPSSQVPGMILHGNETVLGEFIWGLLPPWMDEGEPARGLINARLETAAEKPSFKEAFARRRCLVLADGFYEWKRAGGRKTPYFFHMPKMEAFGFAGIYETRQMKDGSKHSTCSIITTEADDVMAPIHHRMPVILSEEAWRPWLEPSNKNADDLFPICSETENHALECYAVSTLVNSPANDSPGCIKPADPSSPSPDLFD